MTSVRAILPRRHANAWILEDNNAFERTPLFTGRGAVIPLLAGGISNDHAGWVFRFSRRRTAQAQWTLTQIRTEEDQPVYRLDGSKREVQLSPALLQAFGAPPAVLYGYVLPLSTNAEALQHLARTVRREGIR